MQKYVCFVGLLVLLTNCQNDLQPIVSEPTSGHSNARQADQGSLVIVTFQGQDIPVLKLNGQYYLSDDQLIPNELITAEKPYIEPKALDIGTYKTYQASTWPDNVVKYRFTGPNVSTIGATVNEAIKIWNSMDTKIKFAIYNNGNNLTPPPTNGIVEFSCDNLNSSNVTYGLGYQPVGNVKVRFIKNVKVSTVLHEMMHVIGISHEHVRGIRDNYVSIDATVGIKQLGSTLFKTQIGNRKDLTIYADKVVDTYPFDFNSVMIYELPDIIKSKIAGKSIKQSTTLTAKDLNLINKIANYNAPPRVILRNINYATLAVPVQLAGRRTQAYNLAPGNQVVFTYNAQNKYYTLAGEKVLYADLNNGSSSDDLKLGVYSNRITYKPNSSGDYWIVNNYNNPSPFFQQTTDFIDEDGIDGKGAALLKVHTEYPTEIESLITYIDLYRR